MKKRLQLELDGELYQHVVDIADRKFEGNMSQAVRAIIRTDIAHNEAVDGEVDDDE